MRTAATHTQPPPRPDGASLAEWLQAIHDYPSEYIDYSDYRGDWRPPAPKRSTPTMPSRACVICATVFTPGPRAYSQICCSAQCSETRKRGRSHGAPPPPRRARQKPPPEPTARLCVVCAAAFTPAPMAYVQVTCSTACYRIRETARRRAARQAERAGQPIPKLRAPSVSKRATMGEQGRACFGCGRENVVHKARGLCRGCFSTEGRRAAGAPVRAPIPLAPCPICGEPFRVETLGHGRRRQTCSETCGAAKMRLPLVPCPICETPFAQKSNGVGRPRKRACSEPCARVLIAQDRRQRAAERRAS